MHDLTPGLRERRPFAVRASRTAGLFGRSIVVTLVAALFMAVVGAFGTGAAPLGRRLGYWLATMLLASLIVTAICQPALVRGSLDRRPWLSALVLAPVASAPLTVLVWLMTGAFFAPGGRFPLATLPFYFPPVLVVSAAMMAVNVLAAQRTAPPAVTRAAAPSAPSPRFLERLPFKLRGGELYAVRAEDHYLRLYTSKGSDLILMRLGDAIAELDGIEGARTHRSWWVAKAAVIEARRSNDRAVLVLKDGTEAPVARSSVAALRADGWF